MDIEIGKESERRDFYRVPARIPIRVRSLEAQEVPGLSVEISSPKEEADGVADPAIAAVLFRLEAKIDRILSALDRSVPQPLWEGDSQDVSISASGVGMDSGERFELKDKVLVEFLLPDTPKRYVRALARPVGEESTQSRAFAFEVIAESDRDAIVRFSQDVQRLMLRQRMVAPVAP